MFQEKTVKLVFTLITIQVLVITLGYAAYCKKTCMLGCNLIFYDVLITGAIFFAKHGTRSVGDQEYM